MDKGDQERMLLRTPLLPLRLSAHFRVWVRVWVGFDLRRDWRTKSAKKAKKKSCFLSKTGLFGAAGRIRTADLILTNGTVTLLKRIVSQRSPHFWAVFHYFSYHFVPYLPGPFYRGSSQIVVKK